MKFIKVDKYGFWFSYKGDEIGWLFPWHREAWKLKWYSICFVCSFESVEEMDEAWKEYFDSFIDEDFDCLEDVF